MTTTPKEYEISTPSAEGGSTIGTVRYRRSSMGSTSNGGRISNSRTCWDLREDPRSVTWPKVFYKQSLTLECKPMASLLS